MLDDLCLFNSLLLNQILLFCIGCATTVLVTGASIGEMSLQMLVGWVCEELGVGVGRGSSGMTGVLRKIGRFFGFQ